MYCSVLCLVLCFYVGSIIQIWRYYLPSTRRETLTQRYGITSHKTSIQSRTYFMQLLPYQTTITPFFNSNRYNNTKQKMKTVNISNSYCHTIPQFKTPNISKSYYHITPQFKTVNISNSYCHINHNSKLNVSNSYCHTTPQFKT